MALLFYFFNSYRPADSKTFFGLKIGQLLTEIRPLLCSTFKYYMYPLKTNLKSFLVSFPFCFILSFFLFFPTDRLAILQMGKKLSFSKFILFFYFRPTDCMKRAREKSAIQGINRPWPYSLYTNLIVVRHLASFLLYQNWADK